MRRQKLWFATLAVLALFALVARGDDYDDEDSGGGLGLRDNAT
jgi:hypothetical protein